VSKAKMSLADCTVQIFSGSQGKPGKSNPDGDGNPFDCIMRYDPHAPVSYWPTIADYAGYAIVTVVSIWFLVI
jgi:hypothetical protein